MVSALTAGFIIEGLSGPALAAGSKLPSLWEGGESCEPEGPANATTHKFRLLVKFNHESPASESQFFCLAARVTSTAGGKRKDTKSAKKNRSKQTTTPKLSAPARCERVREFCELVEFRYWAANSPSNSCIKKSSSAIASKTSSTTTPRSIGSPSPVANGGGTF